MIYKLVFSYTNFTENSSLSTDKSSDKFIVSSYTNVPENSSLSSYTNVPENSSLSTDKSSDKFIVSRPLPFFDSIIFIYLLQPINDINIDYIYILMSFGIDPCYVGHSNLAPCDYVAILLCNEIHTKYMCEEFIKDLLDLLKKMVQNNPNAIDRKFLVKQQTIETNHDQNDLLDEFNNSSVLQYVYVEKETSIRELISTLSDEYLIYYQS